jgi:hypothetical protein
MMTDPYRFFDIAKCTRLRGTHAVRLTYPDGTIEIVNRDYLVLTVERLAHPDAARFREVLLPARAARSIEFRI